MPERLFVFMQMEFPWELGPPDGRYLLRAGTDGEAEHVIVFDGLAARRAKDVPRAPMRGPAGRLLRSLGLAARPREATPEPAAVATTRVTVIDPVSLSAEHQARAWLEDLDREHAVQDAVAVLNHVVHSHRIASADPYVREVSAAQALVLRAGWGEGEQVADGRWLHARELAPPSAGRTRRDGRRPRPGPGASRQHTAALRPQERLAALLGGHDSSLLCEELVLRARLDLDQGRTAHAALELRDAIALAVRELSREARPDLALRIAELEQLRTGAETQAQAAAREDPDRTGDTAPDGNEALPAQLDEDVVRHALERLEAALRARTAPGFRLKK